MLSLFRSTLRLILTSHWRGGALTTLTRNVHGYIESPYRVELDKVTIQRKQFGETSVLIPHTSTMQQRLFGQIDARAVGEETKKISRALIAQNRTKKELTETGQHRRGQPPQLPLVPCLT